MSNNIIDISIGQVLYRYEYVVRSWSLYIPLVDVILHEWKVQQLTPKGMYISLNSSITSYLSDKWTNRKRNMKKYAYPTADEALKDFIIRKRAQKGILESHAKVVTQALGRAEEMKDE